MSLTEKMVLVLVGLALLTVLLMIALRFLWARYHRARFAFAGLSAWLTIVSGVLVYLSNPRLPWDLAYQLLAEGDPPPAVGAPSSGQLVIVALILLTTPLIVLRLYEGIPTESGPPATTYARPAMSPQPTSRTHHSSLQSDRPPHEDEDQDDAPYREVPFAPWNERAQELARRLRPSFDFTPMSGVDRFDGAWIGRDPASEEICLVIAVSDFPTDEVLEEHDATTPFRQADETIYLASAPSGSTPPRSEHTIFFNAEDATDLASGLERYRHEISQRVERNHLIDTTSSLADVYVDPRIEVGGQPPTGFESYVDDWLQRGTRAHLALLCSYGQGKSAAALMLTHRLLEQRSRHGGRIPILIELRGMRPREMRTEQILDDWARTHRVDPSMLKDLHDQGQLVLIFDGFDELAPEGTARQRIQNFRVLWQFAQPPRAKLLFTGRANYFASQAEMEAALLPQKSRAGEDAYCIHARILPFDRDQIESALRNLPDDRRSSLLAEFDRNTALLDLARRPYYLRLIAARWEGSISRSGLTTSTDVLGQFLRWSYRNRAQSSVLSWREREYFMEGIAAYLVANGRHRIESGVLRRLLKDLLNEIPDVISTEVSAMPNEPSRPLLQRIASHDGEAIDLVAQDVRTSGLLVEDPTSPDSLTFGHPTLMAYLGAVVVSKLTADDSVPAEVIAKRVGRKKLVDRVVRSPNMAGHVGELLEVPISTDQVSQAKRLRRSLQGLVGPLARLDARIRWPLYCLNATGRKRGRIGVHILQVAVGLGVFAFITRVGFFADLSLATYVIASVYVAALTMVYLGVPLYSQDVHQKPTPEQYSSAVQKRWMLGVPTTLDPTLRGQVSIWLTYCKRHLDLDRRGVQRAAGPLRMSESWYRDDDAPSIDPYVQATTRTTALRAGNGGDRHSRQ